MGGVRVSIGRLVGLAGGKRGGVEKECIVGLLLTSVCPPPQGGATSMGLLTPQGPQDWHPAPAQVKQVCAQAVQVCESLGEAKPYLALILTRGGSAVRTS